MKKKTTHVPDAASTPQPPVQAPAEETFTLGQAMDPFYRVDGADEQTANHERAFLAVSFLLDFLSHGGNEAVDGLAAQGLGRCLFLAAEDMALRRKRMASGG
jgi:hypothetical protein